MDDYGRAYRRSGCVLLITIVRSMRQTEFLGQLRDPVALRMRIAASSSCKHSEFRGESAKKSKPPLPPFEWNSLNSAASRSK